MGMNGAGFSPRTVRRKKGDADQSRFVRICEGDQQVRIKQPVEEPHTSLAIFHEALAKIGPVDRRARFPGKDGRGS